MWLRASTPVLPRHLHVEETDVAADARRTARSLRGRCAPARRRRAPAIAARAAARARRAAAARRRRSGPSGARRRHAASRAAPESRAPRARRRGSTSVEAQLARRRRTRVAAARAASRDPCRVRVAGACRPTPVSVTRTLQRPSRTRHVDVDASALLARIDAVAHGVLDERRAASSAGIAARSRARSTRSANCSRSGMRICMSFEISTHELELLAERRRRLLHARHGGAQVGDRGSRAPSTPAASRRRRAPARSRAC